MNRTSESDLIDHVQVCMYCEVGITFMPSAIQWWSVVPNKKVGDPVTARVACYKGPEGIHKPDIDKAVELERYRMAKLPQQTGVPYDNSQGTLGSGPDPRAGGL